MSSEASLHFELHRHLMNAIEEGVNASGIQYSGAKPEYSINGGRADIVVFDKDNNAVLVIEAKRGPGETPDRNIDPYSPQVVQQAFGYAGALGAKYFATYNGARLVLYRTFEEGTPLLDRKTRAYRVNDISRFAAELLEEVAGLESGIVEWDPHHRAFLKRLHTYHERLVETFDESLEDRLADSSFEVAYEEWAEEQGWGELHRDSPEMVSGNFINQASYLLMNKLVFYKLLEDAEAYDVPDVNLEDLVDPSTRRETFDHFVKKVDFEAVYEHDPIFDELPLTNRAKRETKDLLKQLEVYDLSQFDHDVIGQIYEEIIPPDERYALGQYYTTPEVVELITRLTINEPNAQVLDPACGSGGFLVSAYNHLEELRTKSGLPSTHQGLLDQLFGIDVNRFPAHLSAINLALQNLDAETRDTNIVVEDFFNIRPGDERIYIAESATPTGDKETLDIPRNVDAIVGNPPYIRQEEIPNKPRCREHLDRVGASLNQQSDIYTYFFTHATEFLSEGGRLGFITSNQWLRVRYGQALQDFFLNNYKIHSIINPRRRAFSGQLVPTCITILERCEDPDERDGNLVNFVLVKNAMDVDDIIEKAETDYEPNKVYQEDNFRVIAKPQDQLSDDNKWSRYLFAPPEYWELQTHENLVALDSLGTPSRGITSGANRFFWLTDEDAEDWGIEERFLNRGLKSVTQLEGVYFEATDSEYLVFDCHGFVQKVLDDTSDIDAEYRNRVRHAERAYRDSVEETPRSLSETEVTAIAAFKENGYDHAYQYLLWGVEEGHYSTRTCSQRSVWFDLGEITESRLLSPKAIRGSPFFPLLSHPMATSDRFYHIGLDKPSDAEVIAGYLNSTVGKMIFELHGRTERGGLAEMMRYELAEFPVLNPSSLTTEERERIRSAFEALASSGVHEDEAEEEAHELDQAVLAPFGLEDRATELADVTDAIASARQNEQEYEVPVQTEESGVIDISGAVRLDQDNQASLGDFD